MKSEALRVLFQATRIYRVLVWLHSFSSAAADAALPHGQGDTELQLVLVLGGPWRGFLVGEEDCRQLLGWSACLRLQPDSVTLFLKLDRTAEDKRR